MIQKQFLFVLLKFLLAASEMCTPFLSENQRSNRLLDKLPAEWLHIPKTGTTFGNVLLHVFCPEGAVDNYVTEKNVTLSSECARKFRRDKSARLKWPIGDHIPLYNRSCSEIQKVFTFVRWPPGRVLSGYAYFQSKKKMRPWNGGAFCTKGVLSQAHMALEGQTKMVVGRPFLGGKKRHHFAEPCIPVSSHELELAQDRLTVMAFVGITDLWHASICLFAKTFSVDIPTHLRNLHMRRTKTTMTPSVECDSLADHSLYNFALQLFLKRILSFPDCVEEITLEAFPHGYVPSPLQTFSNFKKTHKKGSTTYFS